MEPTGHEAGHPQHENAPADLENKGMSESDANNQHKNLSGDGECSLNSVAEWRNDELQIATDKIHTAQYGDSWYGNKNLIAVTVSADGRIIVSKNNGVLGPKVRKMARQLLGDDVEFVRVGKKQIIKILQEVEIMQRREVSNIC